MDQCFMPRKHRCTIGLQSSSHQLTKCSKQWDKLFINKTAKNIEQNNFSSKSSKIPIFSKNPQNFLNSPDALKILKKIQLFVSRPTCMQIWSRQKWAQDIVKPWSNGPASSRKWTQVELA